MPAKMQPFPEVLKTSSNDFLLKKIARIFNKTHRYNFGSSPFLSLLLLFSTLVGILLRIAEAASAGSNKDNLLMKMEPTTTEIPFSSASAKLWPSSATSGNDGPLRKWQQQRLVRCIFCMNYDDYNNLSTFGCELKRMNTCLGNFCYMRQHKRQEYFLYTSGCINLTNSELVGLRFNIAALEAGPIRWGAETQLCEVGQSVNTCICTNRHLCNNVSAVEPYIEYSDTIFAGIDFDELAHFRFLLPDDPILHEFERERNSGGGSYLLVKDTAISSSCSTNLFLLAIPLLLPLFHQQLASIAFLPSNKFLYL